MNEESAIIARFMGLDVYEEELFGRMVMVVSIKTDDPIRRAFNRQHIFSLKYNTSWDTLMPVVEKILYSERKFKGHYNYIGKIENALLMVKIDELYQAVIGYIEWHNEQQKAA